MCGWAAYDFISLFFGVNCSFKTGGSFPQCRKKSVRKMCDATNNQNVIFHSAELAFVWGCDQDRLHTLCAPFSMCFHHNWRSVLLQTDSPPVRILCGRLKLTHYRPHKGVFFLCVDIGWHLHPVLNMTMTKQNQSRNCYIQFSAEDWMKGETKFPNVWDYQLHLVLKHIKLTVSILIIYKSI